MATLYVMTGPSGSGKSTWAEEYISNHPETCIVSTDKIREELYGDANIQDYPQLVFGVAYKKANAFLRHGYDVIFDATSLTKKDRARIKSKIFAEKYVCVAMDSCYAKCVSNQEKRARKVPEKVIRRQFDRYEFPKTGEEEFNVIWVVK